MNFFNFIKKDISNDSTPYLFWLGFFVSALVALYYSFSFSNHLFWLSLPLSAISIYLSKVFIFEKVYDDYNRYVNNNIKKNKQTKFNQLSSVDQKEYVLKNPDCEIAKDYNYKKKQEARAIYVNNKISEVKSPELIDTININTIVEKTIISNSLPFLRQVGSIDNSKIKEKTTIHKNQKVEFYNWVNNNGDKLSYEEIKEQFSIRSAQSSRLSKIRFNMSTESFNRRSFKVYNGYCFYEKPTSYGIDSSHVFNGRLDNKKYENGKLI